MKIIFLGKPLSGKGTQASLLSKKIRTPHISTGELLRKEVQKKSKLGRCIATLIAAGKLIPDKDMFALLEKCLPKKQFILDGFPRDIRQAKNLAKLTNIDLVIDVVCSDKTILKRAQARISCENCGHIYGLNFKPKEKERCDNCNGRLIHRTDDSSATVRKRLEIYKRKTKLLTAFYKKQKIYFSVQGEKTVPSVQIKILNKIES